MKEARMNKVVLHVRGRCRADNSTGKTSVTKTRTSKQNKQLLMPSKISQKLPRSVLVCIFNSTLRFQYYLRSVVNSDDTKGKQKSNVY